MIGQTISHYKILEKLGEGGMGVVYKAEDTTLRRTVALKFLPPLKPGTTDDPKQLAREAQAAARLNHPNIATIFDFQEIEDPSTHSTRAFITMEYVEGRTLADILLQGPLPLNQIYTITSQLADALSLAHQRGIIHRDLKPSNILLTPEGVVKVLDFGVAKLVEEQTHSKRGRIAGSALYMSPEQIQAAPIDHRSDLFSLGIILYEMATGKRPFHGDHEPALFYSIINATPPDPASLRPDIPKHLNTIITRTLAKDPNDRFQSATELHTALHNAQQLRPVRAWQTGRVRIGLSLIVFTALGVAALLVLLNSPRDPSPPSMVVAITRLDNYSNDRSVEWMTRGIADIAITDLSQSRYLSVVPMARISELLGPGSVEKETTERDKFSAARKANASILVTGSLVKSGETVRVLTKIYDLRTESPLSTEQIEIHGTDRFFELADEIVRRIRLALEIEALAPNEKDKIVSARTNSVEAYREFVLAGSFIEKQYYEDAIRHLQKALGYDSTFARAHNSLAHVYDVLGERELAEESIQKALRFSRELPEIDQTLIALQHAQLRGDWDEEFRLVGEMTLRQPYEPSWHFRLGWHYYAHKRDYPQSVHHYLRALEFDSVGYPLTYHYLGHAYLNWGKGPEALTAFSRHAALRPQDALAQEALGIAYRLTGQYEKARTQFNLALKLKSTFSSSRMNLGILAREEGRFREAEQILTEFISTGVGTSDRIDGHYQLARLHWEAGHPGPARSAIVKCLTLDSLFIPALWISGLLDIQTGRVDSAMSVLEKLETMTRDSKTRYQREFVHHLRGSIFAARGQYSQSIEEFQAAVDLGPFERPFFLVSLAEAQARAQEDQLAAETLLRTLEMNPSYAPAHAQLAQVYGRKNPEKALVHCKRALEIRKGADPGDRLTAFILQLQGRLR